jgi:hypothetical protein
MKLKMADTLVKQPCPNMAAATFMCTSITMPRLVRPSMPETFANELILCWEERLEPLVKPLL